MSAVIPDIDPSEMWQEEIDMMADEFSPPAASDLRERAHHIAFGFPADLSPEERADLTAEIYALLAAIRAEAESATLAKARIVDATIQRQAGWDDAVKALRDNYGIHPVADWLEHRKADWLASVKPQREGK